MLLVICLLFLGGRGSGSEASRGPAAGRRGPLWSLGAQSARRFERCAGKPISARFVLVSGCPSSFARRGLHRCLPGCFEVHNVPSLSLSLSLSLSVYPQHEGSQGGKQTYSQPCECTAHSLTGLVALASTKVEHIIDRKKPQTTVY